MKMLRAFGLLLAATLLLAACDYKELCYDHSHRYHLMLELSLKLDMGYDFEVDDETHTKINLPEVMKVNYYDPLTNKERSSEYVKGNGGELFVERDSYNMVVYNFGTEWTQVRGEGDINTLEAFTSDITDLKTRELSSFTRSGEYEAPGPIIYTPDHLLVSHLKVDLPRFIEDSVMTIKADGETIIETYSFEMPNVTGVENIKEIEAFVTNQARGNYFGRGELRAEPCTIYFPIEPKAGTQGIKTAFNTFGKLPGESRCYLHIIFRDTAGREILASEDITEQFVNPGHYIVVDDPVDVPEPEPSGIAPTVEPWEEVIHDVPIG